MGSYKSATFRLLSKSLWRIHVPLGVPEIVAVAPVLPSIAWGNKASPKEPGHPNKVLIPFLVNSDLHHFLFHLR